MDWPVPDYAEVERAYRALAEAKAELHMAELELTIFKKELALRAQPRQPVQREHGSTEEDKLRGIAIETAITNARIRVDQATATVKFYEYVLSMYQARVYLQTRGF